MYIGNLRNGIEMNRKHTERCGPYHCVPFSNSMR